MILCGHRLCKCSMFCICTRLGSPHNVMHYLCWLYSSGSHSPGGVAHCLGKLAFQLRSQVLFSPCGYCSRLWSCLPAHTASLTPRLLVGGKLNKLMYISRVSNTCMWHCVLPVTSEASSSDSWERHSAHISATIVRTSIIFQHLESVQNGNRNCLVRIFIHHL